MKILIYFKFSSVHSCEYNFFFFFENPQLISCKLLRLLRTLLTVMAAKSTQLSKRATFLTRTQTIIENFLYHTLCVCVCLLLMVVGCVWWRSTLIGWDNRALMLLLHTIKLRKLPTHVFFLIRNMLNVIGIHADNRRIQHM